MRGASCARGVIARAAVFTSSSPGEDVSRLAAEQDVDLVLVAGPVLLDDPDLAVLLRTARATSPSPSGRRRCPVPCSCRLAETSTTGARSSSGPGSPAAGRCPCGSPVPRPRAVRTRAACSPARRSPSSARSASPRSRSSSSPGPHGLVAAAERAALSVIGLSERWRSEGLGSARAALVAGGRPLVLVRKGLRPGGLAPPHNLTRFTWSLGAG